MIKQYRLDVTSALIVLVIGDILDTQNTAFYFCLGFLTVACIKCWFLKDYF